MTPKPLPAVLSPVHLALLLASLVGVGLTSAISYLLFHALVELFAITVGFLIGVVAWYTFPFSRNHMLAFLGAAYPAVAGIDLMHTLAYRGMGVFAVPGADLPTQLWIAARGLEACALLLAPRFLDRPLRLNLALAGFATATALLLGLVGFGLFPHMYVEGSGLTRAKVYSEYLIVAVLALAGYRLWRRRGLLDPGVLKLLTAILALTMVSELFFTFYVGVYDLSNLFGHLAKLASFWLVFIALARTSLEEPFRALSRDSTTYDAIPEEIAVVDRDGRIRQVNRVIEARHGASLRLGDPCHPRLHGASIDPAQCPACQAIAAGRAVEGLELFDSASGRWRQITLAPVRDPLALRGMVQVSRDVTERKREELELRRLNRALRTISASNQTLIHAEEEAALLADVCRIVVERGGYPFAWVGFPDEGPERRILPCAWAGAEAGYLSETPFSWGDNPLGHGPAGQALRTGQTVICNDIAGDPRYQPWREAALARGFAATMAFPLLDPARRSLGMLAIYSDAAQVFTDTEVAILNELAGDLGYGINALRAAALRRGEEARTRDWQQRLDGALKETVKALSSLVEMRDPYTAGHQRRVAELAVAIGRELNLAEERLDGLWVGGLIHDVGKIRVPSDILVRPARLTELEFGIIKAHPDTAYEILRDISFPWPVAEMAREHHERLDGTGYPQGLSGAAIRLESRILGVADAVEAMASHRPYRPALGIDAALAEIRARSGARYDPDVVAACARLFEEGRFAWQPAAPEAARPVEEARGSRAAGPGWSVHTGPG